MVYSSKSCVIQFQELRNKGAESEKYQVGSSKVKCSNPKIGKIGIISVSSIVRRIRKYWIEA